MRVGLAVPLSHRSCACARLTALPHVLQVIGGPRSSFFRAYRNMCVRAFLEARKRRDKIIVLVEMMLAGNGSLPCFARGRDAVMTGLSDRFLPHATTRQCVAAVHNLIDRFAAMPRSHLLRARAV